MKEELSSLQKNGTWQLVVRPKDQKVVDSKWIYKVKEGVNNADPVRFKARLVAKGFTQREGIDYNEIFSPVIKYTTIRVMLALAAHNDWEIEQMDVKTAFLHGDLEETIYMKQPEGFEVKGRQEMVCLLKKSLYSLKQSPRQCYKRFDSFITSVGFERSQYDSCLYHKRSGHKCALYLLLYVDDMLLISDSAEEIKSLKHKLSSEFDMKDIGKARRILGM